MGLIEYILIGVGTIAFAFLLIGIVRRISRYYRERHNMSVWAGVFLLVIGLVIVAYSYIHYQKINIPFIVAASIIAIITLVLDLVHAGIGMGILAFLLQIILSVFFIAIAIAAIVFFIIRSLRRGEDMVLDTVTGTTSGFRNAVQLFFRFFTLS